MTLPRLLLHSSLRLAIAAALAIAASRPTPTQHITLAVPAPEPVPPPGQSSGFTVSGTATVEALPDVADLRATIAVEHASAREATRLAHQREATARAALLKAGVEGDSLALGRLDL